MTTQSDIRSDLLDETLALLRARPAGLSYGRIANETGLTIHWLQMLARKDGISDPGVRRIETLHRFLAGQVTAS